MSVKFLYLALLIVCLVLGHLQLIANPLNRLLHLADQLLQLLDFGVGELFLVDFLASAVTLLIDFVLESRNLVSESVILAPLPIKLVLDDTLGITLQCLLLMHSLSFKLLFPQLALKVRDLLPRYRNDFIFLINLMPQLLYLLIQPSLISGFLVLEVLDDVKFMLFQYIVISIELLVLFLQSLGLSLCFLS